MITQYDVSQHIYWAGLPPWTRPGVSPWTRAVFPPAPPQRVAPCIPFIFYKHRPPMFIKMIKGSAFISGGVLLLHHALRLCLNNPTASGPSVFQSEYIIDYYTIAHIFLLSCCIFEILIAIITHICISYILHI